MASDKFGSEESIENLRALAMPVDWDQLHADGILELISKRKVRILKEDQLPPNVGLHLVPGAGNYFVIKDCSRKAQQILEKLGKANPS